MNSRITYTEDKFNKIIQIFHEQGKTISAHDWGHFTVFNRMISLLKNECETWGDNHPEVVKTINVECSRIEEELDRIADTNKLFEVE